MEINEYALEMLLREQLREARAEAARRTRFREARPPRVALRARLGAALIALGERLAGAPAPRRSSAASGARHG